MPTSAWDGRQWVTNRMAETPHSIKTVIDVGPGEGTNSILGRHLIWWSRWIGIEIFEPYVDRFLLGQKYDDVVVADIREHRYYPKDGYLILFGDVLEHLSREDAEMVVRFHQQHAEAIYVSVPIVNSPQGECFGNEHEAHLHQWRFHTMADLLDADGWVVETFRGVQVGRFWARRV